MKSQSYMNRAMQSRDPRFARILGRLGYETPESRAANRSAEVGDEPDDDLAVLRAAYQERMGKRAFHGWDAETLRAKMAEASED